MMSEWEFYDRHENGKEVFRGEDHVTEVETRHRNCVMDLQQELGCDRHELASYITFTNNRGKATERLSKNITKLTEQLMEKHNFEEYWKQFQTDETYKMFSWGLLSAVMNSSELSLLMTEDVVKWVFLKSDPLCFLRGDHALVVSDCDSHMLFKYTGMRGLALPISPSTYLFGFSNNSIKASKLMSLKSKLTNAVEFDVIPCSKFLAKVLNLCQVKQSYERILAPERRDIFIPADVPAVAEPYDFDVRTMADHFEQTMIPILTKFKNNC